MIKVLGLSMCVLFCTLLLKNYNRTFSAILSIAGGSIIFILVSDKMNEIISSIMQISKLSVTTLPYIKIMLKVLGITLITQFVSDVCRDNGENAIASITETASKIIVISIILPLFETVISVVSGLVK